MARTYSAATILLCFTIVMTQSHDSAGQVFPKDPDGCNLVLEKETIIKHLEDVAVRTSTLQSTQRFDQADRGATLNTAAKAIVETVPISGSLDAAYSEKKVSQYSNLSKTTFDYSKHFEYFKKFLPSEQVAAWIRCKEDKGGRRSDLTVLVKRADRNEVLVHFNWSPLAGGGIWEAIFGSNKLSLRKAVTKNAGVSLAELDRQLNGPPLEPGQFRDVAFKRIPTEAFELELQPSPSDKNPTRRGPQRAYVDVIPNVPEAPCTVQEDDGFCRRYVVPVNKVGADNSYLLIKLDKKIDIGSKYTITFEGEISIFKPDTPGLGGQVAYQLQATDPVSGARIGESTPGAGGGITTSLAQLIYANATVLDGLGKQIEFVAGDKFPPEGQLYLRCQQGNARNCLVDGFVVFDVRPPRK